MVITRGQLLRVSWRTHSNKELMAEGVVGGPMPAHAVPVGQGAVQVAADPAWDTLAEAEVVALCRAHFATFGDLVAAAEHYGLTDGRLSQIQCGIHVGCPRILQALGIKRERGGVYRRIPA